MNIPDAIYVQGIVAGLVIAFVALTLSGLVAWIITRHMSKKNAPDDVAASSKGTGHNTRLVYHGAQRASRRAKACE